MLVVLYTILYIGLYTLAETLYLVEAVRSRLRFPVLCILLFGLGVLLQLNTSTINLWDDFQSQSFDSVSLATNNDTTNTESSIETKNNEEVVLSEGSEENFPDLWDHGIQGLLFLLGATFAPRLTLVFFTSVPWNFWYVVGVSFFPDYTLIWLAFYRGYHHKNYLVLALYCLWKMLSLHLQYMDSRNAVAAQNGVQHQNGGNAQSSNSSNHNGFTSLLEHAVRALRASEATHIWLAMQETINNYKRQTAQLQQRVALLELEPTLLEKLTPVQLTHLRDYMRQRLISLEQIVEQKLSGRTSPSFNDSQEESTCVVCLSSPSIVQLDPCQHRCMCESCFQIWEEHEETLCPLCRISVLSYTFIQRRYNNRISVDEYHRQSVDTTSKELLRLHQYVRKNPEELNKLHHCKRSSFELYM